MKHEEGNPLQHFGTARYERRRAALLPDFVHVDERTLPVLLNRAVAYAARLHFVESGDKGDTGKDWSAFFTNDESVFLARLITTDIQWADELAQNAFMHLHQQVDMDQTKVHFGKLIKALLELTAELTDWYKTARKLRGWNPPHRIEREIERAMRGDLGVQFRGFRSEVEELQLDGIIPLVEEWDKKITALRKIWENGNNALPLSMGETEQAEESERLRVAGARLQEYYRQLYFTMTYIQETAPGLFEKSIEERDDHKPQVGLLIAFLRLFGRAQDELNTFTRRHLDYYHEKVLKRQRRPCVPDRAMVAFTTTPATNDATIPEGTRLLAGVNADGLPSYYETVRDISVSPARVAALQTIFVSKNPIVNIGSSYQLVSAIYAATVANSADGRGEAFTTDDQSWAVLGEEQFDLAHSNRQMFTANTGFAISSGILVMREGERHVTASLRFTPESFTSLTLLLDDLRENAEEVIKAADVFRSIFGEPFKLSITAAEGWFPIEKYIILPSANEAFPEPELRLEFQLPPAAPAIVAQQAEVHGEEFDTPWPVLRVLLNDDAPRYAYSFLRDLVLEEVRLDVEVKDIRQITAYNNQGLLETSLPFAPFGPYPQRSSYLLLGHPELFNKRLTALTVNLRWSGLPRAQGGFAEHYAAYDKGITNESYRFEVSALTDYAFQPQRPEDRPVVPMFNSGQAADGPLRERIALELGADDLKKIGITPLFNLTELEEYSNAARTGYLRLNYYGPDVVFGHAYYPRLFATIMAEQARPRSSIFRAKEAPAVAYPEEPYTPVVESLRLDYSAREVIDLRPQPVTANDPVADNRLFRIHPFGAEPIFAGKEQYKRNLLSQFNSDGYLLLGIRDLRPPQLLSLYFAIAEDNQQNSQQSLQISWTYLQNGIWRPFKAEHILSDTTAKFSTSGLVRLSCPADISRGSGLLDPNLFWIMVKGSGNISITGRCTQVQTHVVEAEWVDNGDPDHLTTPPTERPPITDLAEPRTGIAGLTQLTNFYGGTPPESQEDYYVRGSERLRHKGRAVNLWDIERLVLDRFENIEQVKCLGQHGHKKFLATGEVLVIVVPRHDGRSLCPAVNLHVLYTIKRFLSDIATPFANFRVINPAYERLKINCKIKLTEAGQHHQGKILRDIHAALEDFICPWRKQGAIFLGGSIRKTEAINLIEEHPEVDYVTGFSMMHIYEEKDNHYDYQDTARDTSPQEAIAATRPWSVLIPVERHQITLLNRNENFDPQKTALDAMEVGTDFIIFDKDSPLAALPEDSQPPEDSLNFNLPSAWLET